ncbi:MAG TPA: DUF3037 domain-containing protein [Terriglobales bacterium]|nr:DUF3037 domain-containing protein [Terriglobales bacterium]
MTGAIAEERDDKFVYHILRYTSDLIRDEWVNIGVLVYDPGTAALRLRLIEEQDEFARIRRLQPAANEDTLREFRDHLEDRFTTFLKEAGIGNPRAANGAVQTLVEKWNETLSNGVQLAPQKGVYAEDLDAELERLYTEHVAPPRAAVRVGAPGSRAVIRGYCSQVWRQARLWERIERAVRASPYTFPGDPMRIDYCYRKNGTRGFVQTLSVTRSPGDCKLYAYTADRIAKRAPFASEFLAVTDVALQAENERHRFVRDTLRDSGIEPVPMEGFAVWVAKLRAQLQ